MASNDLPNTTLEFIASNGTAYTGVGAYTAIAGFGAAGALVTVTINSLSTIPQTIDAGAFSHLIDISPAGSFAPIFDIGYSSTSSTTIQSKINNSTNTTLANGGVSNATEGYGTLELSASMFTTAQSISFMGIDNTLILDATPSTANPTLTGFSSAGDQLVFSGVTASAAKITAFTYGSSGSTLTYVNAGTTSSITLLGLSSTTTAGNFALGSSAVIEGGNSSTYGGNLVLSYVPCFLRGTMIDTPFGERAVEDLREGDLVTALVDGRRMPRTVRWTGGGEMDAARHAFRDTAFPVRIRRDAFADGMPSRDLLVTPEHCLLTEAGLVPARMLVNGASVVIDRDLVSYDYFHVELDGHAILLSDGLPTESYLDGENRVHLDRTAAQAQPVGLAAPLAVSRALVEPIWTALRDRAEQIGLSAQARPDAVMTDDPGLRLLLDDGSEIAACRRDSQRHMFQIPRGSRPMRLRSRASVPSEVIGPFVDDRRRLGVAVDRMVLWAGLDERVMPAEAAAGQGWHDEASTARWTDGDAEIDVPAADEDRFLDIHVAATMPYRAA